GSAGNLPTQPTSGPVNIHQYSAYNRHASEHLLALINGILDLSKIQAGKLSVDLESVSITSILQSCLLIVEAKAREKDVQVETHIMPNLPDLMADPLRLKQILINLLSNAVKFTPAKGRI